MAHTNYQLRIASGVCSRCGKNPLSSTTLCIVCLDDYKDRNKAARKRRLLAELCGHCGKNPLHSKTLCLECLTAVKQKRTARVENGLCDICGKPVDNITTKCSSCRSRHKRLNAEHIARRVEQCKCACCGSDDPLVPATESSTAPRCETCFFKRTAHNSLGKRPRWRAIAESFDNQNRLCAYTNKPLVLGVNASLDHILPRSRFPHLRSEPSNTHWVDASINSMKHNMTHEEFIAVCFEVATCRQRIS